MNVCRVVGQEEYGKKGIKKHMAKLLHVLVLTLVLCLAFL